MTSSAPQDRVVTMRRVTIADLRATMALLKTAATESPEFLSHQWVESGDALGHIRSRLEKRLGIVAYDEVSPTRAVAFLGWQLGSNNAPTQPVRYSEIDFLYVVHAYRARGLARNMGENYLLHCKQQGVQDIRVTVQADDESDGLFRALGFEPIKVVMRYNRHA